MHRDQNFHLRRLPGHSPRGQELHSLAEAESLRSRFFSWRGLSGRRYVCSVFQRGEEGFVAQVESGVVIGVAQERTATLRPLCVLAAGDQGGAQRLARLARELGVAEWHVHFCGEGETARDLSGSLLS